MLEKRRKPNETNVAFEVLLSGNCDPDAPQNSYRYEDIFRLVVGENKQSSGTVTITYPSGDTLSQTVLDDSDKQIILDILTRDAEWIPDVKECACICRFSGAVNAEYCDCGTISDFTNHRSRKLTAEEKENIEALISRLSEVLSPS